MNNYCVYTHIFPDGKVYVGLSNNCEKRWKNGEGYISNKAMYKAIQEYGWDNIEHKIIRDNLSRQEAQEFEKKLINSLDSIKRGYNKSTGGESGRTFYSSHVMKVLQRASHYDLFKQWCEMYYKFADDEDVCIHVNFIDLSIRQSKYFRTFQNDEFMKFTYYFRMMSDALKGVDVLSEDYKFPSVHIQFKEV